MTIQAKAGLSGPQKIKRPILAITSFKTNKFLKSQNGQIKANLIIRHNNSN
jgi:hypothetical protein